MTNKFFFLFTACLILSSCEKDTAHAPSHEEFKENSPHSQTAPIEYLATSSDQTGRDYPAPWSVSRKTLSGGKQAGVELLTLDNGKIKIVLIPARGMGIMEVISGDLRLGWNSPVKEVVYPSFINLESHGGSGWLEGFNEWMSRGGLAFAGAPGSDQYITKTGDKVEHFLPLNGKIQNTPASNYEVSVDPAPPYRIRIRGTLYEAAFKGPSLKLVTEISTVPGSDHFQISDQLTNNSSSHQEFQLIYKGSYGSSILEEGAMLFAPATRITPMNDHSSRFIQKWDTCRGPTEGFKEEVYLLSPLSDSNSQSMALLSNRRGDLATSVRWKTHELPCLTIRKNTASEEDGYFTGIEPGTSYPFNRLVERKYGRVPKLAPKETRTFTLSFGIHQGQQSVDKLIAEATQLQTQENLKISPKPPLTK